MQDALSRIASNGVLGALLVIVLIAYYLKDKQLQRETENRIKDGQETQKLLMGVQSSVIEAVHKLGDLVEWVEKRSEENTAARDNRRRP